MIIESIKLHNFGVYLGDNLFEFSAHKPVVLIGGMNGHGKTTFLEAILLGLYGSNSPSYKEKKRITYTSYLKSYINRMSRERSASIELTFSLNPNDQYYIKRSWYEFGRTVKEEVYVEHNGKFDNFLAQNWSMFIEKLVPNALSKFFFFDGEKIVEMAMDTNNLQVKESIKAMLGINTLDVLSADLNKILKKFTSNNMDQNVLSKINKEKEIRDQVQNELDELNIKKDDIESKIFLQHSVIEKLHNQYSISGGQAIEKRQDLMQEKATMESILLTLNDQLIEISSSCLPLKLVENLLLTIKSEAVDEHNNSVMMETIDILKERLVEYSEANNTDNINEFITYIENDLENNEPLYDLNMQAIGQIESLIETKLTEKVLETKKLINEKKKINQSISKINSYLEIDINKQELSKILDKVKKEEDKLFKLQNDIIQIENSISMNTTLLNKKIGTINKMTEEYLSNVEMIDDNNRKIKYIHMSLNLLEKYKIRIQEEKSTELAKTITNCYNKLSNKQNLIRNVKIDPKTLDLYYLTKDNQEIDRMSLSAGEKQLVVISTLWALAICSKNKLPVIIDTPLARLDSKHRESLVHNYFPYASEQTMILSTDSEIDHNYYGMIKDYIGDEYILEYNEDTRSTVVKPGYFNGGMKND